MVDFKKRLSGGKVPALTDPIALYETLDRAVDKGPLRPSQVDVLHEWFNSRLNERDIIVKLHTGQGKTLIGLLMLQSRLNQGHGPAVYLCPDNFLIAQTCEQAKQFGIKTCIANPELPDEFLNSKCILVTSVQKLFNGRTKFGINRESTDIGTLLMDDAHACSDTIREQCRIRIPKSDAAYLAVRTLFEADLEHQGVGTFADIQNGKQDAFLSVPYWAWQDKITDIARILSSASSRNPVGFAWPILKDLLSHCHCVVSGVAIEIEPYIPPLEAFGSYSKASYRIFMSATVTDDAFLIKGLQLSPSVITNPLSYSKESWSGEKMILIPSIIHEDLNRGEIVEFYGKSDASRQHGVVTLVSSFYNASDWTAYGAQLAAKETLGDLIGNLRNKQYADTIVLANRYDGIDLPDAACRILIFDGKPHEESLIDLYQEKCRPDSEATLMRIVRTIEQGMGRSVRGEKDYSVIIVIGGDLARMLRDKNARKYLSSQMNVQIAIGLEIAEMAEEEIKQGKTPIQAFQGLIQQSLNRDNDWKAFYIQEMDKVKNAPPSLKVLNTYVAELEAEQAYSKGDYEKAVNLIQTSLDNGVIDRADAGWYLQDIARYYYRDNRAESEKKQKIAHNLNRLLLLPSAGVTVTKLTLISQERVERIIKWIKNFKDYQELNVTLSDIFSRLSFGVKAERFEQALQELSETIGYAGERPDATWKEGPDNLWALDETHYILWECKNEVELTRAEIHKTESEQMNRSYAWFVKHYPGAQVTNVMIHPTNTLQSAGSFLQTVEIMKVNELKHFVNRVRIFFKQFENQDFTNLSTSHVQMLINRHSLSNKDLLKDVTKPVKNNK
ncbi:MAG TPA: DEAD/DEAH box helicase family protein [Acinetobacter johnsonii]|nr:DEAD/DEAH box helicase family protein [Acinetobacter johnsonii]